MTALFRILRLLSIIVWVGGLIFFAFILAPTAFRVLPSTHEAGLIVGATLRTLNQLGHNCGLLFLLATIQPWLRASPRNRKLLATQAAAVVLMLAATIYTHRAIIPAMERDRIAAGGDIDAAPPTNPARLDFERLHPLSEKVEGTALLLGVSVVILMGLEAPPV
ncbi:MAG TPA: DUF4149 domain-containing protein [Acidobacteriaceae bacterium]|nr:DUF4149 domain-containing protein [Acidobacteriaceae bacterium]